MGFTTESYGCMVAGGHADSEFCIAAEVSDNPGQHRRRGAGLSLGVLEQLRL